MALTSKHYFPMKAIISYIHDFLREDFKGSYYLIILAFLSLAIFLNYKYNFWNQSLLDLEHSLEKFGILFVFYATPVFLTTLLHAYQYRETNKLRTNAFWFATVYTILCLCLHHYSRDAAIHLASLTKIPEEISLFVVSCLLNLTRILFLLLPILLYKLFYDKDRGDFYGLIGKSADFKPYLVLLFIMLPLILWASLQDSFQKVYPRYKPETAEEYLGLSPWITFSLFEITYALRFICVELFFRGFLILGMQKILGNSCVMMMTCVYVFIHFGKPMPETIGSLFGGFMLGVITLKSKNIYGGIFLHMGVALLMEVVAILQWMH